MRLFHGSNIGGIKILEPRLADHERPYIYLSTTKTVASFYIVNAVERPYYWFPYYINKNGIPVYDELYPNALQDVSEGKEGFLYEVDAGTNQFQPHMQIPWVKLGISPMEIIHCTHIPNAWEWFRQLEVENRLIIRRHDTFRPEELDQYCSLTVEYLIQKNMIMTPDSSYAKFIKSKLPWIWDIYEQYCLGESYQDLSSE